MDRFPALGREWSEQKDPLNGPLSTKRFPDPALVRFFLTEGLQNIKMRVLLGRKGGFVGVLGPPATKANAYHQLDSILELARRHLCKGVGRSFLAETLACAKSEKTRDPPSFKQGDTYAQTA